MAMNAQSFSQASDRAIIDLLKSHHCELIVGSRGALTVQIQQAASDQTETLMLVREALRRRRTLTPYARVNGIRLRALEASHAA